MLVPSLVIFGVFVFYPFVSNFVARLLPQPAVPGAAEHVRRFDQYRDVLTSRSSSTACGRRSCSRCSPCRSASCSASALAVLAHQQLAGIGIYRTIFSSTVATSVAVAAVIFGTLMNPQVGLLPWLGLDPDAADPRRTRPGRCSRSRSPRSGRPSGSRSSSCRPGCRRARRAARSRARSTARARGRGSGTSRCRCCRRRSSSRWSSARSSRSRRSARSTCSPRAARSKKTNVLTYSIYTELREQNDPGKAAVLAIALFFITLILTLLQIRLPRAAGAL